MHHHLRRRAWIAAGALALLAALSVGAFADTPAEYDPAKELLGRAWISDTPDDPRAHFSLLYLDAESDRGVLLSGSQLHHTTKALAHTRYHEGHMLALTSRQDHTGLLVETTTRACEGFGELDLCLDLKVSGHRGETITLYSASSWGRSIPPGIALPPSAPVAPSEVAARAVTARSVSLESFGLTTPF